MPSTSFKAASTAAVTLLGFASMASAQAVITVNSIAELPVRRRQQLRREARAGRVSAG